MLYFTSCPIGILNIGLATTFLSRIRRYSNIRLLELELFDMTKEQFVSTLLAWPCMMARWHHWCHKARTCQFFRGLFDRLSVCIFTSDLHHRILMSIRSELMVLECSFPWMETMQALLLTFWACRQGYPQPGFLFSEDISYPLQIVFITPRT